MQDMAAELKNIIANRTASRVGVVENLNNRRYNISWKVMVSGRPWQ